MDDNRVKCALCGRLQPRVDRCVNCGGTDLRRLVLVGGVWTDPDERTQQAEMMKVVVVDALVLGLCLLVPIACVFALGMTAGIDGPRRALRLLARVLGIASPFVSLLLFAVFERVARGRQSLFSRLWEVHFRYSELDDGHRVLMLLGVGVWIIALFAFLVAF